MIETSDIVVVAPVFVS